MFARLVRSTSPLLAILFAGTLTSSTGAVARARLTSSMIDVNGQTVFSLLKGLPQPKTSHHHRDFKTAFGSAAPSFINYSLLKPMPPKAHQMRPKRPTSAPKSASSQRIETEVEPGVKTARVIPRITHAAHQASTVGVGYRLMPIRVIYPEEVPIRSPRAPGPPTLTTATRIRESDPRPPPPRAARPDSTSTARAGLHAPRRQRLQAAKGVEGAAAPSTAAAVIEWRPASSGSVAGPSAAPAHASSASTALVSTAPCLAPTPWVTIDLEVPADDLQFHTQLHTEPGPAPPMQLSLSVLDGVCTCSMHVPEGVTQRTLLHPWVLLSLSLSDSAVSSASGPEDDVAATQIQAHWRAREARREADEERARLEAHEYIEQQALAHLRKQLAGNLAVLDQLLDHMCLEEDVEEDAAALTIQRQYKLGGSKATSPARSPEKKRGGGVTR